MKEKISSSFRLDEQVYFTLGAAILLSFLILGFKLATKHNCSPIILHITANSFEKGNIISFKAVTGTGNNYSWNFGDGTPTDESGAATVHKYASAGKYTASVTVDGECMEFQNVVITEAAVVANLSLMPVFTGPDTAYLNQPANYEDLSTTATNWEWHFEDPTRIDAITKAASHIYKTPGLKKISLMVNGRKDLVTYRYIYVIDRDAVKEAERNQAHAKEDRPKSGGPGKIVYVPSKPSTDPISAQTAQGNEPVVRHEEEKPKNKAPEVSGPEMETLLMELVNGTKKTEDFSGYLCNNLNMFIVYNSNSVTFSAMCENLKGLKKKKIKKISVKLVKDGSTNCINSMIVIVDLKKGLFGL